MTFQRDFDWQLQFIPTIKRIVGPYLLEQSSFDIDAKEATDMLVLMARDMRVACRIRRAGYSEKYPWDFTIRAKRDSGAKTELAKIIDGWGDWMFYGHAEDNQLPSLARWMLVDLHKWRANAIRTKNRDGNPRKQANGDGTYFVAFDVRKFSPPIAIATSHEMTGQ